MENKIPNLRNIEVKIKTVRPGVSQITFKNFEDMGGYYLARLDEFEARKTRVVCIGIVMFVFENKEV